MSKRIQTGEEIYVAPGMLGKKERNGKPIVVDERNDNRQLDPNEIKDKIKIYEREVKEWFLEPASKLLEQNDCRNVNNIRCDHGEDFTNSFIVLLICMSYIEGVEQYKTGVESNNRSKECFIESVQRIYPDRYSKKDIGKLYNKARCGLFHNGMVKGGVQFSYRFENALVFKNQGEDIDINPRMLLNDLTKDFDEYINSLTLDHDDCCKLLRDNFDRLFSVV